MMGHAARTDMLRGKKEKGESGSIRHVDRKAGNKTIPVPSACSRDEKEGKQLHLHVDEKEGNAFPPAC
jgi:hypothetical protein